MAKLTAEPRLPALPADDTPEGWWAWLRRFVAALYDELRALRQATNALDTDFADYQPLDADLTAIAALTDTGGWAKRAAADTWAIATPTYTDVGAAAAAHTHAAYAPLDSPTFTTAVTLPASVNMSAGALAAGTYNPSAYYGETDYSSFGTRGAQYIRVGNVVTVSGTLAVTPNVAGAKSIGLSLPIPSSLTQDYYCVGIASCAQSGTVAQAVVAGDAANDRARIEITLAATLSEIYFHFTYRVE